MPEVRCPKCGTQFSLRVLIPLDQWWDELFPEADRTQPAPVHCIECWKAISESKEREPDPGGSNLPDSTRHDFDPERAVERYREVMARIDAATDETFRDEFRKIAQRMREQWAKWNGSDEHELHEVACGGPPE
jgi:hypothetical protein